MMTQAKARKIDSDGTAVMERKTRGLILVVEDEQDLQELLRYNLEREGFEVESIFRGEQVMDVVEKKNPALVLLDLMLPGMDGLEVCQALRSKSSTASVPIVMLTAKGEEADIVTGLELGADDYIPKPFSPRVLLARIKAIIRRRKASQDAQAHGLVRVGELSIDPERHEVHVQDEAKELTHTEFRLLEFLARRPGRVFTRSQIVKGVQGGHVVVTDRSVDVHVVSLRRKLGEFGQTIQTVRGVGYRMEDI